MYSKIVITVILVGIILCSCGPNASIISTAIPTTTSSPQPTALPATAAPTPMPTVDPFTAYKNSFDAITDLTATGFTSNQNGIPTESKSAIRINKDIVHSGSQSLEAFGTIGSPANSTISIDFPIRSLIGQDSKDLSNKILHVSVFIPKDSPIDKVNFGFSNGGESVIIPVFVAGSADVKGRWFSNDINIKRFYENEMYDWIHGNRNIAKDILMDCVTISIVGQRSAQGDTVPASFIVDDLKWEDVPYTLDSIPVNKSVDSLRKYADLHNLKIGSILLCYRGIDYMMDPRYVQTLAQEFNLVSGINSNWPDQKPDNPSNMVLAYTQNDDILKLGLGAQLSQKGSTGGWYGQLPKWIFDEDFQALQPYLENRIEQDLSRYKGNIYIWDVFNEVVDDDGNGLRNRQKKNVGNLAPDAFAPYGYHYSPWVDGNDTSLIRAAFVKARQIDPNAKLFLNDFSNEQVGQPKAETFYRLVADMKQAGVPIDGVGFQLRVWIDGDTVGAWQKQNIDTFLKNVDQSVKRFADLGLLVEFSEVEVGIRLDDIDLSTPAGKNLYEKRLADQAKVYGGLAKIAVENKNLAAFIIWMVSDRYQQGAVAPGYGDTSIFDAEYKPKPAYYAIMNELKK